MALPRPCVDSVIGMFLFTIYSWTASPTSFWVPIFLREAWEAMVLCLWSIPAVCSQGLYWAGKGTFKYVASFASHQLQICLKLKNLYSLNELKADLCNTKAHVVTAYVFITFVNLCKWICLWRVSVLLLSWWWLPSKKILLQHFQILICFLWYMTIGINYFCNIYIHVCKLAFFHWFDFFWHKYKSKWG